MLLVLQLSLIKFFRTRFVGFTDPEIESKDGTNNTNVFGNTTYLSFPSSGFINNRELLHRASYPEIQSFYPLREQRSIKEGPKDNRAL